MNTAVIREKLHEYIEHADDKHLAAMYVLLEKEMENSSEYDAATLELFYGRVQSHQDGTSASFTAEEAFEYIRKNKPKK